MVAHRSSVPQLKEFDSIAIIPLETRTAADSPLKRSLSFRGNSFISSVFVESIDPGTTVKVNYFDYTTGQPDSTERNDLNSHDLISASSTIADRILVTRFHDKPIIEVLISGAGSVKFSVYVTLISDMLVDVAPGATIETAPSASGVLGDPVFTKGFDVTPTIGSEVDMFTEVTIPASTARYLHTLIASCRIDGIFRFKIDDVTEFKFRTGGAMPTKCVSFLPAKKIAEGEKYKVTFEASTGFPATQLVDVQLMLADVT